MDISLLISALVFLLLIGFAFYYRAKRCGCHEVRADDYDRHMDVKVP